MYNVQGTMYNVHCTMYNVQCALYNVRSSFVHDIKCRAKLAPGIVEMC